MQDRIQRLGTEPAARNCGKRRSSPAPPHFAQVHDSGLPALEAVPAILILIFRRFEGLGVKLHSGRGFDDHGGSGGGLAKASVRSKSSQEGKIRNAVIAASLLKKL